MSPDKQDIRDRLHRAGLRATAPRTAVFALLSDASRPLAFHEVADALGDTDWDRATTYRNLVRLTDAGLARVVSRAGGMARYTAVRDGGESEHAHPHFVCSECGGVSCLPQATVPVPRVRGKWSASVRQASIQLQGRCPSCLDREGAR
ncbi:transcriptional repressor [bacterium]|nr:transcriptional repressor [bacterium]HPF36299.1 transcriptional repressor [Candidatus Krumholzibacteria bacterium]HRX52325.1 transcriptional repressor [Candidatus Krumholzibacteria bacterium]